MSINIGVSSRSTMVSGHEQSCPGPDSKFGWPCYMLLTLLGDKLCNIASFDPFFKNRCSALYQNRQQVAIDEQMLKPRHRSDIRQFIRDKPNKWGIKLWVLADSSNGYAVDLISTLVKPQGRLSGQMGLDMM